MIWFNGAALESVAPVKIVDVLISPIRLTPTARQRPVRFGSDFVRLTGGSRTVDITFALLTDDLDLRQQQLQAITDWARMDAPAQLRLPGHDGTYLEVICTALPEPSMRQWWESKLRIVFTTFDNPFWTSDVERHVNCNTGFTVLGSAPPLMRIEHDLGTGATVNYAYSDNDGNEMRIHTTSAMTGLMTIDLNRQLIYTPSAAIGMALSDASSRFLPPHTGDQQIIYGAGTIYWRERWQ